HRCILAPSAAVSITRGNVGERPWRRCVLTELKRQLGTRLQITRTTSSPTHKCVILLYSAGMHAPCCYLFQNYIRGIELAESIRARIATVVDRGHGANAHGLSVARSDTTIAGSKGKCFTHCTGG